jgi:hypothetical protein
MPIITGGRRQLIRRVPGIVAWDDFTDTDTTALESHVATGGGTWTKLTGSGAGSATIDANRAHNTNDTTLHGYFHSYVPNTPDYDAECDIVLLTDNNLSQQGPCVRISTTAFTFYTLTYVANGNTWQILRRIAGTGLGLATSAAQTLTAGVPYRARISARGNVLKGFVDGALVVSVADDGISAAGRAGLFTQQAADAATGIHLDRWGVIL